MNYEDFIRSKRRSEVATGHKPGELNEHLFDFQHAIVSWAVRRGRAAIFADTGLGKQQPVTEPVLTPNGWSTMGALKAGDFVIGSNGLPTKVTGVFPQGVKPVYRLELSDGTFVRAGDEHLWSVRTKVHRYRGDGFQVMTTKQIAESIRRDWQLPMFSPVATPDIDLPIDPYALGVMLGDGQSSHMTQLCTDTWIGNYLGWRKKVDHETCDYVSYFLGPVEVLHQLGDLGLKNTSCEKKFVPRGYLHSSPRQRLELLNGLMDTDGYPMPDGGSEFSSTSRHLIDAVCDLVRSLGGVARGLRECAATFTYRGEQRQGKQAWRVNLKLPAGLPMFKLPRKAEKHISPSKYCPARIIRSVVNEGIDEPQVCIMVEAEDSLYVTRDYIVTHNTLMQLAWADEVVSHTGGMVLILAPLAVSEQTIEQGSTFGIEVKRVPHGQAPREPGIWITNYERIDVIEFNELHGIVLDESSILKSHNGKTRTAIIESCQCVPYRLSCTATPSPNDFEELGNQCEFLGVMTRTEMLATYFVNDTGDTGTWRLKGWGASKFWAWMGSWSVVLRNPSDIGFDGSRYELPPMVYHEHVVETEQLGDELFARPAQTMLERRKAQRDSIEARCKALAAIVNAEPDEPWLIWCHLNDEADLIESLISGSINVQGSDSAESKTNNMMAFTHGELRVLASKPKICGYGMNWQHCARMAFVGLDDSFEKFYQAVRRCYRFGQKRSVQVHIFTAENEGQILANIKRKEVNHNEMSANMIEHMKDIMNNELAGQENIVDAYREDVFEAENFTVYLGDCVKHSRNLPDNSIDYSVFSPPFADLFVYSNSDHDMGNCKDDGEFVAQLRFLIAELFRTLKPGRNISFHCMNLPTTKMRQGFIGLRDFRGDLIRAFQDAGFIYHSEVAIWKDPVVAMQRTKALGLLHKTIRENSTMSRMGLPDYVVTMRKPGDCETRVTHGDDLPVMMWQKYASPIWTDINQSRTLNKLPARDDNDEKHMCPLQLDVIERCIHLWTNKGDVILSPFTGIGSEGYCAVRMGRKFIGIELKPAYWELACQNIADAEKMQEGLFTEEETAA